MHLIEEGLIETTIQEQGGKWRDMNIPLGSILHLQRALRVIFREKDSTEKRKIITATIIDWHKECKALKQEISRLEEKIAEAKGEEKILNLIKDSGDSIFIFRGYKDDEYDKPDHREAILNYCVH